MPTSSANEPEEVQAIPEVLQTLGSSYGDRIKDIKQGMVYDPDGCEYNLTDDFLQAGVEAVTQDQISMTPASRVVELLEVHHDPATAMNQLDRILTRHYMIGSSINLIAADLAISVRAASRLFSTFKKRLERQADMLDVNTLISDQMAALDLARQECFKILLTSTSTPNQRLNAVQKITALESRRSQILDTDRFFEVKGFAPKTQNVLDTSSRAQLLISFVQQIVTNTPIENSDPARRLQSFHEPE